MQNIVRVAPTFPLDAREHTPKSERHLPTSELRSFGPSKEHMNAAHIIHLGVGSCG